MSCSFLFQFIRTLRPNTIYILSSEHKTIKRKINYTQEDNLSFSSYKISNIRIVLYVPFPLERLNYSHLFDAKCIAKSPHLNWESRRQWQLKRPRLEVEEQEQLVWRYVGLHFILYILCFIFPCIELMWYAYNWM